MIDDQHAADINHSEKILFDKKENSKYRFKTVFKKIFLLSSGIHIRPVV